MFTESYTIKTTRDELDITYEQLALCKFIRSFHVFISLDNIDEKSNLKTQKNLQVLRKKKSSRYPMT